MLAQAPTRSTAVLPAQPIARLDFMPAWKIWDMLLGADPEIKLLNAQAWRSRCPDWPAIDQLSLELARIAEGRPCSEPAIFSLRVWDVLLDRLEDRVGICRQRECSRCAPL